MIERRKIFVGSSSEAQGLAEDVGNVIKRAGMEPLLWKDLFPAGTILLERIEQLPGMVDGAVLLATPHLICIRKASMEEFSAPVPNVVFEYGYLCGRLSLSRVAICTFEGADMPSDLGGLTNILAGSYDENQRLDPEVETKIERWLTGIVPLAAGIPPMRRVHGYSGKWEVQNRFSLWHGIPVREPNLVWWEGKTILRIRDDGQEGHGSQIGRLKVNLGQYRATWDVANEVIRAVVGKDGSLTMRIEVRARSLVDGTETGMPPSERVREELPSGWWDLTLTPVPGTPQKLEGTHDYKVGGSTYSLAKEFYTYADW